MDMKKVIKKIIEEWKGDDDGLAEYLSNEFDSVRKIPGFISVCEGMIREEEISSKKRVEGYREKIKKAQGECKHWDFTYYGDPSGGNDSFHECTICGKQW